MNDTERRMKRAFWQADLAIIRWMARVGPTLLRLSLGIVFLWLGFLKFFPGLSPAYVYALCFSVKARNASVKEGTPEACISSS